MTKQPENMNCTELGIWLLWKLPEEGEKSRPNLLAWASGREEVPLLGGGQKRGQAWGALLGAIPN